MRTPDSGHGSIWDWRRWTAMDNIGTGSQKADRVKTAGWAPAPRGGNQEVKNTNGDSSQFDG